MAHDRLADLGGGGKRLEAIGGSRDGGLVSHGTWSMSAGGIGESDASGYCDLKFRHEAITDASEDRSEVGKSDACPI